MKTNQTRTANLLRVFLTALGILVAQSNAISGTEATQASLYDSVRIESRTFPPGHPDCSVGVYISNSTSLAAIVLAFEFRSLTPGAFISATMDMKFPQASRLRNSPLGDVSHPDDCPLADRLMRKYPTESATLCAVTGSAAFGIAAPQVDFVSPDGLMYVTSCTVPEYLLDSVKLKPGADTTPSAYLVFGVSSTLGTFMIDTACIRPSNRLLFADTALNTVTPNFRPSVIDIVCGPCRCHADPWCDGVTDIVDVVQTIDRAFRGEALPCAPYVVGSNALLDGSTDFDCNGTTDVLDVVKVVNVSFEAADPTVEFCNPCL